MKKYWLISHVFLLLLVVRMTMSWMRLPSLLGWLDIIRAARSKELGQLQHVAYYTDRFLTLFPANERGNCLPRSLVLYGFAKRYGFPVRFHCGVRWVGQELTGHAWLSLESKAFLESNQQWKHFEVTYSFPESSESNVHLKANLISIGM